MDINLVLIIIMVILVFLSAFFSATETSFSSVNRIRLKNMAENNHKGAKLALKLSDNYDTVLSTILVGNNMANILCTSIATVVFTNFFGNAGVTISTIVLTIVILMFGEITPKSVAIEKAETFACLNAPVLRVFIWILYPVNFLFKMWKKLLSNIFHLHHQDSFTEQELISIVDEVQQDGVIDTQEGDLIRSAIEFKDLDATDILIPRVEVIAAEDNISNNELNQLFLENGYSRIPVFHEDIDHIIGIIHEKDFIRTTSSGDIWTDAIKPAVTVSKGMKISKLLKTLQSQKIHMAIIVDEFGGTMGIATLEDILEELVGEIWDESDEITEQIIEEKDDTFFVSGSTEIDNITEKFNIDDNLGDISTVNGWVMKHLGKIPETGDSFTYKNLLITVSEADSRRANEIKIKVNKKEEADITN